MLEGIEDFLLIFYALFLPVLLLFIYKGISSLNRETFEFYKSLGAEPKGYRRLIYPMAELSYGNERIILSRGRRYGGYIFTASIDMPFSGLLRLWKGGFLDALFHKRRYDGLFLEYEDAGWAWNLLRDETFKEEVLKLFESHRIVLLEIKGGSIVIGFGIGRGKLEKYLNKQDLIEALNSLVQLKKILEKYPYYGSSKEKLREWLTWKLPILITLSLILVGALGGFYDYKPMCFLDLMLTGGKLLSFPVILYVVFTALLVGGEALYSRVILKTFSVLFVCSLFISLIFVSYINGRFDSSQPEIREDRIKEKYRTLKQGYRVTLEEYHKNKWWCDSFIVSEEFYKKANVGDKVDYVVKRGYLGVEWWYEGLGLKK